MTSVISTLATMRYSAEHKKSTRHRIVAAASAAFRERGVGRTGVDEVMRRAGLTHGGFYAHFADKSELVAEACAAGFAEAVPNLARIASRPTRSERVRLLVDSYLAPRHRDNRQGGCVIVAVAADLAREGGAARRGFSQGFLAHVDRLAAALRLSDEPAENRAAVLHLLSALVGALLLARAVEEPAESAAILRTMRRRLKAQFAGPAGHDAAGGGEAAAGGAAGKFSSSHDLLRPF